jgi:hypothetical protein
VRVGIVSSTSQDFDHVEMDSNGTQSAFAQRLDARRPIQTMSTFEKLLSRNFSITKSTGCVRLTERRAYSGV